MCDYSLMSLPNRLAVADEELVSYRFPTGAMGFASECDLQPYGERKPAETWTIKSIWKKLVNGFQMKPIPAVCIPPGARLRVRNIPENLQRRWRVSDTETAVFLQTSAMENTYRDAIQFGNERTVSLQELPPGMHARVLSLSASEWTMTPSLTESLPSRR